MSVEIRPAAAGDLDALAALEADLLGADGWSRSQVADELEGAGRHVLVATMGGEVVGYAVTLLAGDVVDLLRIAVAASHQRRGVASALLAACRRTARLDGAHRLLLEVSATNRAARDFYADAGFVQIDVRRAYYRDGSDALVLRGDLGTAACGRKGA